MSEHKTEDALHFRTEWLMRDSAIIGDAVITTDFKGRITSLNPIAESLTGWTQSEAIGLSLESVFKIVHPETRMTVESPTVQALRNGVTAGLPNHTVLIARDGRELPIGPIDHSATPIRNDHGELTGAVLVFRDITNLYIQEKRIRAALAARGESRNWRLTRGKIALRYCRGSWSGSHGGRFHGDGSSETGASGGIVRHDGRVATCSSACVLRAAEPDSGRARL